MLERCIQIHRKHLNLLDSGRGQRRTDDLCMSWVLIKLWKKSKCVFYLRQNGSRIFFSIKDTQSFQRCFTLALHSRICWNIVHTMSTEKWKKASFFFADPASLCFSKYFGQPPSFTAGIPAGKRYWWISWAETASPLETRVLLGLRGGKKTQMHPTRGLETRMSHHWHDHVCRVLAFDPFSVSRQANLTDRKSVV